VDYSDLNTAQLYFKPQIPVVVANRRDLHDIAVQFSQYYSIERLRSMPLEHYALGNDLPEEGFHFCHTIERKLDGLGRVTGSTSNKFGVYFGRTKSDDEYKYRHTKKFGSNYIEAFENVKQSLVDLVIAGKQEDIDALVSNPISTMFKGKVLSTYYPKRYLNVFSDSHLEYFLTQLNIDTNELLWSDAIVKREALRNFKSNDPVMKNWSLDVFMYFLYNVYPGRPPKEDEENNDLLKDLRKPQFPSFITPDWIDLEMENAKDKSFYKGSGKNKGNSNPDYQAEAREMKQLGDRGEKIALEMEKQRLESIGRGDLIPFVKKAEYDYLGYDIESFEKNGDQRFIEVKTTRAKAGNARFFLSQNELDKAQELENYFIYMVYDILSQSPKIWVIDNPFNPVNPKVKKIPISYQIEIQVKNARG
tara:strand:+ start:8075 stop:9331 length:1257 start_codon:yes stop_codon:yes gene_type:complete